MVGERTPTPPPPIPPKKPEDIPYRPPPCAINLGRLISEEADREPTEEELRQLQEQGISSQTQGALCPNCLENPLLPIFSLSQCIAKHPTRARVFIRNAKKPKNQAQLNRTLNILSGPPGPPRIRKRIPGLDEMVAELDQPEIPEAENLEEESQMDSIRGLAEIHRGVDPNAAKDIGY